MGPSPDHMDHADHSAVRFSGAMSCMTPASAAPASPREVGDLGFGHASSHASVSPIEPTDPRWATCSRKAVHDAGPAAACRAMNTAPSGLRTSRYDNIVIRPLPNGSGNMSWHF